MNLTPFGQLFKASWELYKKKIGTLAVLFTIPFIVSVLMAIVTNRQISSSTNASVYSAFNPFVTAATGGTVLAFALVILVISLWIQVASVNAIASSDQKPSISELLSKSWPMILPYLLAAILTGLAVFGGIILLIVPGIIFAVWFSFVTFTVVLDGKRGTEALKASKALVSGRFGAVFSRYILLGLSFIGIAIVASIVMALLPTALRQIVNSALSSFVFSPLGLIFTYLLYGELKSKGAAQANMATSTPTS